MKLHENEKFYHKTDSSQFTSFYVYYFFILYLRIILRFINFFHHETSKECIQYK